MERSISLYRELGDRWGIALSTDCLGTIAKRGAQYERAAPLYESSVTLFREVGDRWGVAAMLANLAAATKHLGDARLAAARWRESLVLSRDLSLHEIMASCLDGLANLFAASGTVEQVARLLGAADALFANISAGGTPIERSEFYGAVATLRARMGDEAFSVAWAEGRRMRLEEAVEYALALAENPIADSCANEHTH